MRKNIDFILRAMRRCAFAGLFLFALMSVGRVEARAGEITTWQELQDAIDAAGEGETITLTQDITATGDDSQLEVVGGKKITIDLNGKKLDRGLSGSDAKTNGRAIYVKDATLTIKDSSGDNSGKICGGNTLNGNGAGIYMVSGATVNMTGGQITDNITLKDGISSSYGFGGGIFLYGGTLNMSGGEIIGNTSAYGGGGVYISGGTFNLSGGRIEGNKVHYNGADYSGGGIYYKNGTFKLSGNPAITGNNTNSRANDIYVSRGKTINIEGALGEDFVTKVKTEDTPSKDNKVKFTSGFSSGGNTSTKSWSSGSSDYDVELTEGELCLIDLLDSWEKLQKRLDNAKNNSQTTITLTQSIIATSDDTQLVVADKKNIIIDLKGFNINRNLIQTTDGAGDGRVFKVAGKLTIKDSSENQNGKIKSGKLLDSDVGGAGVLVENGGEFILESGEIYDNSCGKLSGTSVGKAGEPGGGVYISENGRFEMKGGKIYNNTVYGNNGGGVYVKGKFIMSDGIIGDESTNNCNRAECGAYPNKSLYGDGVCIAGGSFEMNGGAIKCNKRLYSNIAYNYGGGVAVLSGEFKIKDGEISKNAILSAYNGGGIYIKDGTVDISGGKIVDNGGAKGAGIYVGGGNVSLSNVEISGNTSGIKDAIGAGIYIASGKTLKLGGGSITGNFNSNASSIAKAGGIFIDSNGKLELSGNPKIADNYYGNDATKKSNIYLSGSGEQVNIAGKLTSGFSAGILASSALPVKISTDFGNIMGDAGDAAGWSSDNDAYIIIASGKGSERELYLCEKAYNITFELNGGTIIGDTPESYDTGVGLTLPSAVKNDYEFKGWYESDDFSGEKVEAIGKEDFGVKAFYAKWAEADKIKTVTLSATEFTYSGEVQKPVVTVSGVKDGVEWELTLDTDYSVSYTDSNGETGNCINAGTYTITIQGKGNYSSYSETKTFTISQKSVSPTITLSQSEYIYDGWVKEPEVQVYDGETLIDASEYEVTYLDNTEVSTAEKKAKVTVRNKDGGNYIIAETTVTFTIKEEASDPDPEPEPEPEPEPVPEPEKPEEQEEKQEENNNTDNYVKPEDTKVSLPDIFDNPVFKSLFDSSTVSTNKISIAAPDSRVYYNGRAHVKSDTQLSDKEGRKRIADLNISVNGLPGCIKIKYKYRNNKNASVKKANYYIVLEADKSSVSYNRLDSTKKKEFKKALKKANKILKRKENRIWFSIEKVNMNDFELVKGLSNARRMIYRRNDGSSDTLTVKSSNGKQVKVEAYLSGKRFKLPKKEYSSDLRGGGFTINAKKKNFTGYLSGSLS